VPPAAAAPQAYTNLAQLMRGIMFPNSNVIFFAQDKNPVDVKHSGDSSLATDPLSGTFGGWAAVENSSLALKRSRKFTGDSRARMFERSPGPGEESGPVEVRSKSPGSWNGLL
jgi:hypothetical protein